jgi:hypothetical protein
MSGDSDFQKESRSLRRKGIRVSSRRLHLVKANHEPPRRSRRGNEADLSWDGPTFRLLTSAATVEGKKIQVDLDYDS